MNVRIPDADNTHRLGGTGDADLIPNPEPTDEDGYDFVNHPQHYNMHPKGIECIDVIEDMTLNVGTAIKHLWRAGLKPDMDEVTDLRKAIVYIEFEINRLERRKSQDTVIQRGTILPEPGSIIGVTPAGKVTDSIQFA